MIRGQEEAFWSAIQALQDLGILRNVMVIGSWAEYLYPPLFNTDFVPNLRTRDVDFFYRNINLPKEKIALVEKLKETGYTYDEIDGISRFYKADLLELEFLTRVLGAGTRTRTLISPLGIKAEGLRVINILADFACEFEATDTAGKQFTVIVPESAAYAVQKLLTNPDREPPEKKAKDIVAVQELLYHIQRSEYHREKLREVCDSLSKRQTKTLETVCAENNIVLFR